MINNEERIKKLKDEEYKELFRVKKDTFYKMLNILNEKYVELHRFGGKNTKLTVLDKLIITLGYYREYRSIKNVAFDYGVVKSTISESIDWVEQTLIKDGTFSLPKQIKIRGYQRIKKIHSNSETPKKASKLHCLMDEKKRMLEFLKKEFLLNISILI